MFQRRGNMDKDLKTRIRICTTLKPETYNRLKKYSEETMIASTKIIEAAVIEYIKKRATTQEA